MSATRFTLYPSIDTDTERLLRDVRVTSGSLVPAGEAYYLMQAGIAYDGRVDYVGTFDGSKYSLEADVPFKLVEDGTVRVPADHSVVLDVTPNGLAPSLEGTTVTATVRHSVSDPITQIGRRFAGNRTKREALEVISDYLNLIRASDETVSLALPRYIQQRGSTGEYHDVDSSNQDPASGSFVNGNVSVTVQGTETRPVAVMLTAHATFEGLSGTPNAGGVAISDGTTDWNEQQGGSSAVNEIFHVSTSYAIKVSAEMTFTLRLRDVTGTTRVFFQSITAITSEV